MGTAPSHPPPPPPPHYFSIEASTLHATVKIVPTVNAQGQPIPDKGKPPTPTFTTPSVSAKQAPKDSKGILAFPCNAADEHRAVVSEAVMDLEKKAQKIAAALAVKALAKVKKQQCDVAITGETTVEVRFRHKRLIMKHKEFAVRVVQLFCQKMVDEGFASASSVATLPIKWQGMGDYAMMAYLSLVVPCIAPFILFETFRKDETKFNLKLTC